MGNFQFSGTFSTLPDPMDYQPFPVPVVGYFLDGKHVRPGWESGILKWAELTPAQFLELNSRWVGAGDYLQGGKIPFGSGWQSISARFDRPINTGFDGYFHLGTTMLITHVTRY